MSEVTHFKEPPSISLLRQVEASYASGKTLKAIAVEVGVCYVSVWHWLKWAGVTLRPFGPPLFAKSSDIAKAVILEKLDAKQLAVRFGYSDAGSMRNRMRRKGIALRDLQSIPPMSDVVFEQFLDALDDDLPVEDAYEVAIEYA